MLGGRRLGMRRPRVRSVEQREVRLATFEAASSEDPLGRHTLEAIASGVTMRRYARSLEPLPVEETERSTSRSAVSRRFVALTQKQLAETFSRPLDELDLRVVMIDGIAFRDHCVLLALGVATDGAKHVLGLWEGSTEHSAVAKALLRDLIERGLPTGRALLFVIDGSKALRKAVRDVFGGLALVQRCQIHKERNVLEHLPQAAAAERAAGPAAGLGVVERGSGAPPAPAARRFARRRASRCRGVASRGPGGDPHAARPRGPGGALPLYRTLRSTNPIENLNGSVADYTKNVKRWRGGGMILRWVGAAVVEASQHFHKIRGHRDRVHLVQALERHEQKQGVRTEQEAA